MNNIFFKDETTPILIIIIEIAVIVLSILRLRDLIKYSHYTTTPLSGARLSLQAFNHWKEKYMLPTHIRVSNKSALALVIAIFGLILDILFKLMGLAFLVVFIIKSGFFPGIIWGLIAFIICFVLGWLIKKGLYWLSIQISFREKYKRNNYTLQDIIEGCEQDFYRLYTREYGEHSLRRGALMFEDNYSGDLGYLYVNDVIAADLIIQNDNVIWEKYVPRIKKSVKAVLKRSWLIHVKPDEWPIIIEIAQRVKKNLPNIRIIPNDRELYQMEDKFRFH